MNLDPHRHLTPEEHAARRARITAALRAETGIDEAMIERLVREFYVRVQADRLLGPIFAERIADWEPHLQRMFAFWSSVTLMTGVYHGRPMERHMSMPVDAAHFDRWLDIFRATARDLCLPAAAAHFIQRAEAIAASIEQGLATVNGVRLANGERYRMRA
jgi:hemoglobin